MTKTKLTQEEQDWITAALDPYHDVQRTVEGCPDDTVGRSFVRIHNQTCTIGCTADDDQIAIIYDGTHGYEAKMNFINTDDGMNADPDDYFWHNPVEVIKGTSTAEPTLLNLAVGTAGITRGTSNRMGTTLRAGVPSRLIGIGVEVHDQTQALYKRGTIAAVSCGGSITERQTVIYWDDSVNNSSEFCNRKVMPMLPYNFSNVCASTGAVVHEASKGIYVVPRMYQAQKPARFQEVRGGGSVDVNHPILLRECAAHGNESAAYFFANSPVDSLSSAPDDIYNDVWGLVPSGFEPFVIRIMGCAAESSFRITLRTIVEYFPEFDNIVDLSISTPSPAYSPRALKAYHDAIRRLPMGVPVCMNAKGDWWRLVRNVLLKVAPYAIEGAGAVGGAVLTGLGQPGLAAAATIATTALGQAIRQIKPAQKPQSNKPTPKKKKKASR